MDAPDPRPVLLCLGAALLLAACATQSVGPVDQQALVSQYEHEAMDWRERRYNRLTEPFGWLSLVGLEPLQEGRYQVGTDESSELVVASGPAVWGTLTVIGNRVWFDVEPGADIRIINASGPSVELQAEGDQGPTFVEGGSMRLQLLDRGGRPVLRLRDSRASTRVDFAGLDYFPFNPDWRIEARWLPHPDGRTLLVANVLGELVHEPNPGMAEFDFDGRTFGLEAVESDGGDQLFFILADRTSGRESYGLGRFLYSDLPEDGRVVLDFNRAYNPPCAFTEYSTCPLPPPENRLDVRIEAGELTYRGSGGLEP
jgi:uncharacterized protein